jgi:superfamily I DNA and RNA helicase
MHRNGTKYNNEGYDIGGYDKNKYDIRGYNSQGQYIQDVLQEDIYKNYTLANGIYTSREIYATLVDWKMVCNTWVERYFSTYKKEDIYSNTPSTEQKKIIRDMSQYLLIQARAGCGKTTTMIWKTHFIHKYLHIPTEKIIFLAFNKSAAEDIRKKCREK